MGCGLIEQLECRRLLSGGFTAVGSPSVIASVTGQFAPKASCPIGSGNDVFLAFVNNSKVVEGLILDSTTGNVIVPAFAISTQGQSADPYRAMAAVEDTQGNAVLAFGVSNNGNTADNLFIARISATGQIVLAPTAVAAGADDQSSPALAIDTTTNSVAVVYVDEPNIGAATTTIFAGVVSASGSPAFAAVQISVPTTAASQYLSAPAVIFASNGGFVAAWDRIDFNSSNVGTFASIDDRVFSPAGVLGIDPILDSEELGGSSNNDFSPPEFVDEPDGTLSMYTDVDLFDASDTYLGTKIIHDKINILAGTVITTITDAVFTSPNEELIAQILPLTKNSINYDELLLTAGTNGSLGLTTTSINGLGLDKNDNVIFANTPIVTTAAENVWYANGLLTYTIYDTGTNTTNIWGQVLQPETPVATTSAWSTTVKQIKLPADIVAGTKLTGGGEVTVSLADSGSSVAHDKTTFTLFAVPTNLDGSPIVISTFTKDISLHTGKSLQESFRFNSLPESLVGSYNLEVEAADATTSASATDTAKTYQLQAPVVVPKLLLGPPSVTTAHLGEFVTVSLTVTNAGNIPAVGFVSELSPSLDGMTALDDIVLEKTMSHVKFLVNHSMRFAERFKVLSNLIAGLYYLIDTASLNGVSAEATAPTRIEIG